MIASIPRRISEFTYPLGDGGEIEPFSGLYSRYLGQIAILGGNCTLGVGWAQEGIFFTYIKNSEYESQTKKIIQIVISTISHFWSPNLTTFWQSVFVSLFCMVYTPPSPTNIFFVLLFFLYLVARGWENFKFLGDHLY